MQQGGHPVMLICSSVIASVIGFQGVHELMQKHSSDFDMTDDSDSDIWKKRFHMMKNVCDDVDARIPATHTQRSAFEEIRGKVNEISSSLNQYCNGQKCQKSSA